MNETTQQEKTTQLSSRNEQLNSAAGTKQLNSSVGMKQLNSSVGTKQLNSALPSTAYNRLQPPTTAYNRLQPPTTACNRLQPPAPPAPPLQQNRLFSTYCPDWTTSEPAVAVLCQKSYLKNVMPQDYLSN
ncbi:hypothetical protein TNCV_4306191 [Trichonephila clavipes]|nr:hypothetical protein TNCV_4306191 [Trichonephila clavipes]